jgi:hypothetical protein
MFHVCDVAQNDRMNDLVYPVNGGMEDWAYAASWDPERVIQCDPITYDGYPASKTEYDNSTLRVFNMLIETSDAKTPPASDLGTSLDIMTISEKGNGHVARNIRLALLANELVEPYLVLRTVNGLDLSDDIVPLVERGGSKCKTTKTVAVPHDSRTVTIEWTVGGSLVVDKSTLFYAQWDSSLEAVLDCEEQPDMTKLEPKLSAATSLGATSGNTQFAGAHAERIPATVFSASIDLSQFRAGDEIAVVATARVDQKWGSANDIVSGIDVGPRLGPQSHVVNVRTNANWYHTKPDGSKVIQGRLDWVSIPLTIVLKDFSKSKTTPVEAEELSLRYDESLVPNDDIDSSVTTKNSGTGLSMVVAGMMIVVVGVVVILSGRAYLRHTMRYSHRERVRDFIDDEKAITPGLQSIVSVTTHNSTGNGSSYQKGFSDQIDEAVDPADGVELGTYT